jgi:parvulin-like peptidyl-prolyl isomerase
MAKATTPKVITKKHQARLEREQKQRLTIIISAIAILIIVLGVIGYGVLDQTVLKENRAVARVNGDKVTVHQLEVQTKYYRYQLIQNFRQTKQIYQIFGSDPTYATQFINQLSSISSQLTGDATTIGETVLTQLINDRLIRQEAERRGITVTKAEVDAELQNEFGYYPNGTPTPTATLVPVSTSTLSPTQNAMLATPLPTNTPAATATVEGITETPATPTATVAPTETPTATSAAPETTSTPTPTATPYTLEGYNKEVSSYLESIKDLGFTEDDLRFIIESSLYRQKVMDAVTADIKPEAEQVWARHILVADQAKAAEVITRLKNGENWYTLAAEMSSDTNTRDNGGDLGWFSTGEMDSAFEKAAFALKVGETSAPVQSSYGWHIIQVLGHETRPLTETQLSNLRQSEFSTWLSSLNTADTVKKYDLWKTVVPSEPTLTSDDLSGLYNTAQ